MTNAAIANRAANAIATALRAATDACAVRAIARYDREARWLVANADMDADGTRQRLNSMAYAVADIERVY